MAKSKVRKRKDGTKVNKDFNHNEDDFYWDFAAAYNFLTKIKSGELEEENGDLTEEGERLLGSIMFPTGVVEEFSKKDELFAVRSVTESNLKKITSQADASLFSKNEKWLLK